MTYYGYYPPPPPEANRREKKLRVVALGYVGLVVLVAVGVAVYVMLQRLETGRTDGDRHDRVRQRHHPGEPDPGADGLPAGAGAPGQRPGQRRDDDPRPRWWSSRRCRSRPRRFCPQGAPAAQVEKVNPRHFVVVGEDDRP
jgi:hypothetical protein